MLSCYIIDDEEHPVELLTTYVGRTNELALIGWSNDPIQGLQAVASGKPDILFLDVDMPGLSGIDVYRILGNTCHVVFTTGHARYAVDAYDLAASDFLLKPIRYERFLQAVHRIRNSQAMAAASDNGQPANAVFLQTGQKGKLLRVVVDDIVFAESINNYLKIHLIKETLTAYLSLRDLTTQLPQAIFDRVHKSYVVNFERITGMEGNRIWMEGGSEVPVGAQFREAFFAKVNQRTLKK